MTIKIPLTKGQVALIDDEDYELVSLYKWHASYASGYYAVTTIPHPIHNGKWAKIHMHRLLLGLKFGDKRQGDHINHDTLDNRRNNLRVATNAENGRNRIKQRGTTSKYIGVSIDKANSKWQVHIALDGKHMHVGRFVNPEEAARAYDRAALELHGEFATLNFPIQVQ